MALMPIVFFGHGSPTNALEDNLNTEAWAHIASRVGKPKAILSISAHWCTNGTAVTAAARSARAARRSRPRRAAGGVRRRRGPGGVRVRRAPAPARRGARARGRRVRAAGSGCIVSISVFNDVHPY